MPPVQWGPSWSKYLANGLRTDSDEMNTIRRACAANDIWVRTHPTPPPSSKQRSDARDP